MKPILFLSATIFIAFTMLAGTVSGDPPRKRTSARPQQTEEQLVFVTGSLIPQRIQLHPIGTKTVSPVRIIDRREIDGTGRYTTPGAFVNEPAVRIIGH